jgi:hypothetical protein
VWIAAPTFIPIEVSPAKAVINSDPAIVEKLTGTWLRCQATSALQWTGQSNYRLKAEDRSRLLRNPRSDPLSPAAVKREAEEDRRRNRPGRLQSFAKHSPPMLLAHFVRDACPR